MKVRFLGTAAFEGIPAMFCRCELCGKAMASGGKDVRTRTSVTFDDELKIDFPPDTFTHMIRDKLDLEKLKDIVFTHSHSDHLYPEDMVARLPGYAQSEAHAIHVYGNGKVLSRIGQVMNENGGDRGKFVYRLVKPFERVELQTAAIVPLPASHDPGETCLLYFIEKDGRNVLYGHDSGTFPDETRTWLSGCRIDLAILECTMGHADYRATHMNVEAVLETKERMQREGALGPDSVVVVTHFSHNAGLTHADLTGLFEPHGIRVAYDGMTLEM